MAEINVTIKENVNCQKGSRMYRPINRAAERRSGEPGSWAPALGQQQGTRLTGSRDIHLCSWVRRYSFFVSFNSRTGELAWQKTPIATSIPGTQNPWRLRASARALANRLPEGQIRSRFQRPPLGNPSSANPHYRPTPQRSLTR